MASLLVLNAVRLGLWFLPFQTLLNLIEKTGKSLSQFRPDHATTTIQQIIWAINVSTKVAPGGAKCLARALTAKLLMNYFGYSSDLRIGVTKGESGNLEAHAWVEYQGRVAIGNLQNLARFTPLPSLEAITHERNCRHL